MDLTTGVPFWLVRDGLTATYPKLSQDRRLRRGDHRWRCYAGRCWGGGSRKKAPHRPARGAGDGLREHRLVHGALLQYELDTHLLDLADRIGAPRRSAAISSAWRRSRVSAGWPGRSARTWTTSARDSLYLATHRRDLKVLERERRVRREIGIEVDLLSPSEIRSRYAFQRPAALLSRVGGEVDPLRLTHALLAAGLRDGLEVYDRTGVARISRTARACCWRPRMGGGSGPRKPSSRPAATSRRFSPVVHPAQQQLRGRDLAARGLRGLGR